MGYRNESEARILCPEKGRGLGPACSEPDWVLTCLSRLWAVGYFLVAFFAAFLAAFLTAGFTGFLGGFGVGVGLGVGVGAGVGVGFGVTPEGASSGISLTAMGEPRPVQ